MKHSWKIHAALFLANLIYGANYSIAKEVMPAYIKPFGFIFIRVATALFLYTLIHELFIRERIDKKDLLRFFTCALFGVAINQLMFFKGLSLTVPINAALIMVTTPILVLVVSILLKEESFTIRKLSGIILGAAGAVVLILFGKDISFGSATLWGDIMIFINAASYGIYLVIVRSLTKKYKPLTIIKWVFIFGFILTAPFGFNEFTEVQWSDFPEHIWWATAFVIIGTTFFAYYLNNYALSVANPSLVSAYIYLQPFLAAVIALSLGKDHLTWIKILSGMMIFAGVYLVSFGQKKESSHN